MSLRPDDRSSRGRSGSVSRERSRSRSNVRAPRMPSPPSVAKYPQAPPVPIAPSVPMPGSFNDDYQDTRSPPGVESDRAGYFRHGSVSQQQYRAPPSNVPYPQQDDRFVAENYWKDLPPHERPGYVAPTARYPQSPDEDDDLAYGDVHSPYGGRQGSYSSQYAPRQPQPYQHQPLSQAPYQYGQPPQVSNSRSNSYTYQYAEPPEKIAYTAKPQSPPHNGRYAEPQHQYRPPPRSRGSIGYDRDADLVEVAPSGAGRTRKSSTAAQSARHSIAVPPSAVPDPHEPSRRLSTGMSLLSVGGAHAGAVGGGIPPPSPLLEAYRGTYQSISPMPLAMRPADDDSDLSDLEPLSHSSSRASAKAKDKAVVEVEKKKHVKIYDPEKNASTMADALKHHKVKAEAICDVLPGLSHDEVMYLRKEYKKQVKVQGKGVNLPKHIKTKLTGNFGKVAYVTALGRWESEGYWANFFYQSHSSRHELLIESLMGRTNAEIQNMEEEFKDKRYADSLVKCMEKELKMDKFRTAILMVLERKRQEEQDVYPAQYRQQDVDYLHRALTAKQGGESGMLEIVVRRSDAHLREVLKLYEQKYQDNFPRAVLRKSNNLVGEVITHILNGVVNKPARDAILLHHAIDDIRDKNKSDQLRYELLISRLVRVHWDRAHLVRVKRAYILKYKTQLEDDIEEATRGDFCEFLLELCQVKATAGGAA